MNRLLDWLFGPKGYWATQCYCCPAAEICGPTRRVKANVKLKWVIGPFPSWQDAHDVAAQRVLGERKKPAADGEGGR